MALNVGASTALNQANMNSLFAYDAVVDASLSGNSGDKYLTIDNAIDAGAKSILVKEGSYTGFTADVEGLMIVAENYSAISRTSTGVWISSTITISANSVALIGLNVDTAANNGIDITTTAADVLIRDGSISNCPGAGISVEAEVISLHIENMRIVGSTDAGILLDGGIDTKIIGCDIHNNTSMGIQVAPATGGSTSVRTVIVGCMVKSNADGGISVEGGTDTKIIGCSIISNTTDGVTIINTYTGDADRTIIIGCDIRSNTAYGVQIAAGSDDTIVDGCVILGNTTAETLGSFTAGNIVT
jgi:parallel beta-helix repeat protein